MEKFNAGETIIEHVSNSSHDRRSFICRRCSASTSVTKHVLMLWLVATFAFPGHHHHGAQYLAQDKEDSERGS